MSWPPPTGPRFATMDEVLSENVTIVICNHGELDIVPGAAPVPVGEHRSVVWRGSPRDYWNNMEAIHHEMVQELFNSGTETDEEPPDKVPPNDSRPG